VHVFNQRDIAGILAMIRTLGALVGAAAQADQRAAGYETRLATIASTARPSPKPKVYFEEWDDPLIGGIGWVSELIEIAGGEDILSHLRLREGPDHFTRRRAHRGARCDPGIVVRQEGRSR
jgi:iron complex transport system substrate-binding protein